jgi:hypothetical protein
MSDELPEIFERVRPVAAPAELRQRVLSAVEREIRTRRKPAWERALEWGVAACLVLGIGLNAWQWRTGRPWQRALAPAPNAPLQAESLPLSGQQLAEQQLADLVSKRAQPRRAALAPFGAGYEKLLEEISKPPAG